MHIIGHRGSAGTTPENTLASFSTAIQAGVNAIELDVQVCSTGELVVIHDSRVDRTTDGEGLISQLSLTTLRKLNAGNGEKIPLLQEVLDLVNNKVEIHIELKAIGTAKKTAQLIEEYVEKKQYTYQSFLISSFNHQELMEFRTHNTECRIAALIAHTPVNYAAPFKNLGLWSLNVDFDNSSAEFVRSAHQHGYRFLVYTVNNLVDLNLLREMGVDGVFTDQPALFCQANTIE